MVPADLCVSQAVLAAPPHAPEAVAHKGKGLGRYAQSKLSELQSLRSLECNGREERSNKVKIRRGVTTNPRHRQGRLFTSRSSAPPVYFSPLAQTRLIFTPRVAYSGVFTFLCASSLPYALFMNSTPDRGLIRSWILPVHCFGHQNPHGTTSEPDGLLGDRFLSIVFYRACAACNCSFD